VPRMRALRPTSLPGLLVIAAALVLLVILGLGTATAASVTVRPGDTLGAIAARNGTSVGALARANGITDPDVVRAGTRLALPGSGTVATSGTAGGGGSYTVRSGDTLGGIAARNGSSVGALARANGITDPNVLSVGRRLTLPGGGGGASIPAGMVPVGTGGSGGYTVRGGDTLGSIAAAHGTTVRALAALNNIANPNVLPVGRRLSVPGGSPSLPGTAPTSSSAVAALLQLYADRHGVDPALARAIAWQESRWTQSARSSVGAIGVMQLMPATARWFGPAVLGRRINPRVLEDNIEGGVAYLGWLQRQSGDTRTTIGAYYQGLTAMRTRGPYDDTRDYIASVLSFRGRV